MPLSNSFKQKKKRIREINSNVILAKYIWDSSSKRLWIKYLFTGSGKKGKYLCYENTRFNYLIAVIFELFMNWCRVYENDFNELLFQSIVTTKFSGCVNLLIYKYYIAIIT